MNQITLSWVDRSTDEAGFKIERSTDGIKFVQVAQVLPSTTTYRDTGILPTTLYFYRIIAFNSAGNAAPSNVAITRTAAPATCPLTVTDLSGYFDSSSSIAPLTNLIKIAAGFGHDLGLRADGKVVARGANYYGQATVPTNLSGVVAIAAGGDHSLALRSNGTVVQWGGEYLSPPPTNLTGVTAIAAGGSHSLALKSDGTVVAWDWSWGPSGQIIPPSDLTGVVAIAAGRFQSLALKSDGTVVAWGADTSQIPPDGLSNVVAIAAGGWHSLALKSDGTVVEWGNGLFGQSIQTPKTDFIALAAGDDFSVGLTRNGTVVRWSNTWRETNVTGAIAISANVNNAIALSTAPLIPWALDAKILGPARIGLSWTDTSGGKARFVIERLTSPNSRWIQTGTVAAGVTNFTDTSVMPGVLYEYRIRARNNCSLSAPCPSLAVRIEAPPPPQFVVAEPFADQIGLSWYITSTGVTNYVIERALDDWGEPLDFFEIGSVSAADQTGNFIDPGLAADTTYWYRIRARNGVSESAPSMMISASIVPPATPYPLNPVMNPTNGVTLTCLPGYPEDQDGFDIERATGSPQNWKLIATVIATNSAPRPPIAPAISYVDPTAAMNATYWYRARAFNRVGVSGYSEPANITVLPPDPPQLSVHAFADEADLFWSSSYPEEIIGTEIEHAVDVNGSPGADWTPLATVTNANAYVHRGLALNSVHWYRVRSFNWTGRSFFSEPARTAQALPGPPLNLSAQLGSTNRLDLSWTAAAPYDQSGFQVERAPDAGGTPGNWTEIAFLASSNSSFANLSDSGIPANSTNWYRVRAFNGFGYSDYTAPLAAVASVPLAPYLFETRASANRIVLLWETLYTHNIAGYKIERATDVNGTPGQWSVIGTNANHYFTTFTDSRLNIGTTYWYRVRAYNWVGDSSYSATINSTISPPPYPIGLVANTGLSNNVLLAWQLPGNNQLGFRIERAADNGGAPGLWSEIARVTNSPYNGYIYTYADAKVRGRTTFWYRVRAFNGAGVSDYSAPVLIVLNPPSPPSSFDAQTFRNEILLSWWWSYSESLRGFKIERAPDVDGVPGSWSIIATNSGNSYKDTGHGLGTKYWYRVRAFSWVGDSPPTDPVFTEITPPSTPYFVDGRLGATNRVHLTWIDPYGDEDGLRVERAPDASGEPGDWSEIATILAPGLYGGDYIDAAVSPNSTNWYRLRAFNTLGYSAYSDAVRVAIVPPADLVEFTAAAYQYRDEVELRWTAAGERVAGYIISRAQVFNGPFTPIAAVKATTTAYTDTGVAGGNSYWYQVQAFNWVGGSPLGDAHYVYVYPPSSPYGVVVNVSGTNCASVTWDVLSINQDGFYIERAADNAGCPGPWRQIGETEATPYYSAHFFDTNVLAYTTNWYRVRAYRGAGVSDYSEPARLDVIPPPAPNGLTAYQFVDTFELNWQVSYAGWISGYRIERAPDVAGNPGSWSTIAFRTDLFKFYKDTGLQADMSYWYRVSAYNWVGESAPSEAVRVTVKPPKPPCSFGGVIGDTNQVRLRWYNCYQWDITGFKIDRAPNVDGQPGAWTEIGITLLEDDFSSFIDTNVIANTTNWYRIRSYNIVGISQPSEPMAVHIIAPGRAASLGGRIVGAEAQLGWSAFYFNDEIAAFAIERAPDVGGSPGDWSLRGTRSPNASLFQDTGLTPGQSYWYRVHAYNWIGPAPESNLLLLSPTAAGLAATTVDNAPLVATPSLIGHDVLIRWQTTSGTTNIVQAADNITGEFADISPEVIVPLGETFANFLDVGALTNRPARYYRIRIVP